MKAVAFCGSARKNGNTALLLKTVLESLEEGGVATELVELAGNEIPGCKACFGCFKNKDKRCVFKKDVVNSWYSAPRWELRITDESNYLEVSDLRRLRVPCMSTSRPISYTPVC